MIRVYSMKFFRLLMKLNGFVVWVLLLGVINNASALEQTVPVLNLPQEGVHTSNNPCFSWSQSGENVTYNIAVSLSPRSNDNQYDHWWNKSGVGSHSICWDSSWTEKVRDPITRVVTVVNQTSPTTLNAGTVYYWHVVAIKPGYSGKKSQQNSFHVETPVTALSKPNIILVYADDIGWNDLNLATTASINTGTAAAADLQAMHNPNMDLTGVGNATAQIDELASKGVLFTQAYANAPVCSPSRSSLMTGTYSPAQSNKIYKVNGALQNRSESLPRFAKTIAHELKQRDYSTILVGKWHLQEEPTNNVTPTSHPGDSYSTVLNSNNRSTAVKMGFDINIGGHQAGKVKAYEPENGAYIGTKLNSNSVGTQFPLMKHVSPSALNVISAQANQNFTEYLAEEASQYIINNNNQRNEAKPFFLYFSLYSPHKPVPADCDSGAATADAYRCMVNDVDAALTRVMNAVYAKGISNNTYIIYTQDNGAHIDFADPDEKHHMDTYIDRVAVKADLYQGEAPLREAKHSLYEGGIREPIIVMGPNINADVRDKPVIASQLYQTIKGLADRQLNQGVLSAQSGESLYWYLPAVISKDFSSAGMVIREGGFKLINHFFPHYDDDRKRTYLPLELYDLENDPTETCNLLVKGACSDADDHWTANRGRLQTMASNLCAWISSDDYHLTWNDFARRQVVGGGYNIVRYPYVDPQLINSSFPQWSNNQHWAAYGTDWVEGTSSPSLLSYCNVSRANFRQLQNAAGKCLDVKAGGVTNEGNIIQTHECVDPVSNPNAAINKNWYLQGTGEAQMVNTGGMCLTLNNTDYLNQTNGGKVTLNTCANSDNQKWSLVSRGNGYKSLVNKNGLCLDVKGGTIPAGQNKSIIQVWSCANKVQHYWDWVSE